MIGNKTFIIKHSIKDVEYDARTFVEKNQDEINQETLKNLSNSTDQNI